MSGTELPAGPSSSPLEQTRRFTYDIVEFMEDCHKSYGDCFTIRLSGMPPMVLVSDPALARRIISNHELFEASAANKETMVGEALGRSFLMVLGGKEHGKLRPVLKKIQKDSASDPAVRELIRDLTIRRIESFPLNEPFKLRYEMQTLSLEIMTHIALGPDPIVPRQLLINAVHHMVDTTQFGGKATMLPNAPAFLAAREEVYKIYDEEIARRRRDGRCGRNDMLSILIDPASANEGELGYLSTAWLRDQMLAMTVAGYDTTATTLSWTMFHLLRQPELSTRLLEECHRVAETADHGSGDKANESELIASIVEAERLHPVTPLINRMTTEMTEIEVEGQGKWMLPKGVMVCPALHLLHRHSDWGEQTDKFIPQRILDLKKAGGNNKRRQMNQMPFYAWGAGARSCPGQHFAGPEITIIIATLLSHANLQLMRREEKTQRRAFALVPEKGAEVVFTGRRAVG